jgi:hypothetical protein
MRKRFSPEQKKQKFIALSREDYLHGHPEVVGLASVPGV